MKRTAVQFGAGNIGRGFMAQLFHEAGLEVVFIDVAQDLLDAVNNRGQYSIRIVGPGADEVQISNIRAIDARDSEAVANELAQCQIACTSVGAAVLPRIAANIAAGITQRFRRGGDPLNIVICENLHDAGQILRKHVGDCLEDSERDIILNRTGFAQAVVSRMVPLQAANPDDPLAVRVEAYKRLPIDGKAVIGNLPEIAGIEPVQNFEAQVERKLFTHNCAHATLGYLGYRRSLTFGYEALNDAEIIGRVRAVMAETGEALIRKHGFDRTEHLAHVDDLLDRFANMELGDTCFRLAKDPLRKLAPNDRLVGAARLCEEHGVSPIALSQVIAEALKFNASEDPSAQELQAQIDRNGVERALETVCGIQQNETLGKQVLEAYAQLR